MNSKPLWKKLLPLFFSLAMVVSLSLLVRYVSSFAPQPEDDDFYVATLPELPDLTNWPEPFIARLHDEYSRLLSRSTRSAALGELARLYQANGFLQQAQILYQDLEAREPMRADWPYLLATVWADYSDQGRVVEALNRSIKLDPAYSLAYLKLGYAYLNLGQWTDAHRAFETRLAGEPQDAWALLGLAQVAIAEERVSDAQALLLNALQVNANISAIYDLFYELYLDRGDVKSAEEWRKKGSGKGEAAPPVDARLGFVEAYCYDPYALIKLARRRMLAGEFGTALGLLERAKMFGSSDSELVDELQIILDEMAEAGNAATSADR